MDGHRISGTMSLRPPRTAPSPVALARQAAWIIGAALLWMVFSVPVQLGAEADTDAGGKFLLTLLTLVPLLLLFGVPCWRFVTWLRAVARGRATGADRVRVLSWAAVWQWLALAWLVFSVGMWAVNPTGLWRGQGFGLAGLALDVVGGVVTVGLLAALRRWIDRHTRTQADGGARAGELAPLLPGTALWVRAGQAGGSAAAGGRLHPGTAGWSDRRGHRPVRHSGARILPAFRLGQRGALQLRAAPP